MSKIPSTTAFGRGVIAAGEFARSELYTRNPVVQGYIADLLFARFAGEGSVPILPKSEFVRGVRYGLAHACPCQPVTVTAA